MRATRPQSLTFGSRDYRGDRPSRIVLRLEQRAREQRAAFLAGRRPLWRLIAKFIRQSLGL